MPTAKSIFQVRDAKVRQAEDAEFLGRPPPDKDLIQVTHVLPGKDLLPHGLDEPGALDDIRRKYRVYITRDTPNILDIRGETMHSLQQALQKINLKIQDMRLSNNNAAVRFMAQTPTNATTSDLIRAELGTRPYFLCRRADLVSNASALNKHLQQLVSDITASSESLMALNKTMGLRVNFGRLIIGKRKKGSKDEVTYDNFAKLMDMYSVRGGAVFTNKLQDTDRAEQLLQFLVKPDAMVCRDPAHMRRGCEVIVVTQDQEITAEADYVPDQGMQLTMVRATKPETWARLNWTVAAPDMDYDWSFRVDAWDKVDVPPDFRDFGQRVMLAIKADNDTLLPIPSVNTTKLARLNDQITQVRVRSWAIVPFKETEYALKINITKTLKGACTEGEPEVTWGIELYAPHWEESANHASGGRKDWGKGLENIWPEGHDLKSRLGGFLRTILEIQALLNRASADASSP
ncbi:hypothetical protein F66182_2650 [Fusarium sp. NRRL 66182]|nr:hypothetical protein F66182_2650 [Fusarium sp. NRRL 66182]